MPLTQDEEKILESIVVASDNDPHNPEFPPLRLRRYALLKDGLSGSIEPFTEKVFFIDKQYESRNDPAKITDEVTEGHYVREFITDEFREAQNDPTAKKFTSRIRRYEKDGKVIYLNPVDGHRHRGQKVYKIFRR